MLAEQEYPPGLHSTTTIVSGGGLVRKPGEHQRERLLFDFITIT